MAESSIIREFLVGIGFKIDVDSQKKFKDGVEDATKQTDALDKAQVKAGKSAVTMAAAFVGATAFVAARTVDFAAKLENLHFAARRTGAAASSLKAVANAAQDVGVTAEQAQSSIEGVARFMRNNPGGESYIASLGVQTRDANGHLRDTVDIVNDIGKAMSKKQPWLARQYAETLGIDENYMLGMRDPAYQKSYDRAKKDYDKSGVDKSNNGAHDLMSRLRALQSKFEATVGTVGAWGIETGATLGGGLASYFGAKSVVQAAIGKALGKGAQDAATKAAATAAEGAAKAAAESAAATAAEAGAAAAAAAGGATSTATGRAIGLLARALPWAGRMLGGLGLLFHSENLNSGESEDLRKRRKLGPTIDQPKDQGTRKPVPTPASTPAPSPAPAPKADAAPKSAPAHASAPAPAGQPAAANAPQTRAQLIAEMIAASKESEARSGVPALVTFAQWALESHWGEKKSGKNNVFGVKARKGQAGTDVVTHEVVNGKSVKVVQRFADYDSLADAFTAHANLLAKGRAYANARKHSNDPSAFADALSGVYATDLHYGDKLKNIMSNAVRSGQWQQVAAGQYDRPAHIEVKQDVKIQVTGTSDPDATARSVAREQRNVNDGIVRNLQGAMG
ncbi:flagellar protein FlgJ [Burkholderia multivorans]